MKVVITKGGKYLFYYIYNFAKKKKKKKKNLIFQKKKKLNAKFSIKAIIFEPTTSSMK
jgi:hypothetical protein